MRTSSLAFWLSLLVLLPLNTLADKLLRFGTFQNAHSPALHICEQVLREAYAKLGRSIAVEYLPGERSLYWARSGRLDGELCRGQAHAGLLFVPTPLYQWQLGVFSNQPLSIQSWADLKPYKIAYERSMSIISAHQELDLVPVNNIESGILLLSKNRVDILLDDYNSVLYAARKMKIEHLLGGRQVVERGPIYHLPNPKHALLAMQLEVVLAQMARDGRIEQIEQEVMAEFMLEAARDDSTAPASSSH
ncbi:extracellular solute-binding protein, family 3 [Pseudomonas pohangensis]|uniref:Extracellular solute-binding protein, family 3 n=1 Tax=Pseudomonas pohangensis TaxID=364197 RepID=A0A1H2H5B9_9PSED|nr:transporter substrate-binding domain-containing protein [Pseudomonas pohangensis]SDU27014.1 extracellular solute-binding protein, family 3 [Pseudomonas pohangensis]